MCEHDHVDFEYPSLTLRGCKKNLKCICSYFLLKYKVQFPNLIATTIEHELLWCWRNVFTYFVATMKERKQKKT